jgi:2'-5' RNA ligase
MIAFLPADYTIAKQNFPHMTLVFAGAIDGAPDSLHKDLLFHTALIAAVMCPFPLLSNGIEKFGTAPDEVDVIRLIPTAQLQSAYQSVSNFNKSSFPGFKPHVTVGPAGSTDGMWVPPSIFFDKVVCSWGDEHLVFDLSRRNPNY